MPSVNELLEQLKQQGVVAPSDTVKWQVGESTLKTETVEDFQSSHPDA